MIYFLHKSLFIIFFNITNFYFILFYCSCSPEELCAKYDLKTEKKDDD